VVPQASGHFSPCGMSIAIFYIDLRQKNSLVFSQGDELTLTCFVKLDRDVNAAKNILSRVGTTLSYAYGDLTSTQ